MPSRKRATPHDDESSCDEGAINLMSAVDAKTQLNEIKSDREKKRAQLQAELDEKLVDLQKRTNHTVEAHTKQLAVINQQQIDRLREALKARNAVEHRICEKLTQVKQEGRYLATFLDKAYEYRLQKAQADESPISAGSERQQEEHRGLWANPKRAKMHHSGSG